MEMKKYGREMGDMRHTEMSWQQSFRSLKYRDDKETMAENFVELKEI